MDGKYLEDAIADAVGRSVDEDYEAQRIFDAEIVPLFAPLAPSIRARLAFKIAYDYDDRLRRFIDPKAGPISSDGTKKKSKATGTDLSPFKYWVSSDGWKFAYTTSRERDDKDRDRFASFVSKKDGERRDVVRHAKKKDAMVRAARLMIEREAQLAPAHAKEAFATAVAVQRRRSVPTNCGIRSRPRARRRKKAHAPVRSSVSGQRTAGLIVEFLANWADLADSDVDRGTKLGVCHARARRAEHPLHFIVRPRAPRCRDGGAVPCRCAGAFTGDMSAATINARAEYDGQAEFRIWSERHE